MNHYNCALQLLKDGKSLLMTTDCTTSDIKDFKLQLRTQIAADLREMLGQYKNKDIGIRIIGEKTNVGEKTLKRILGEESIPHTNTVRGFYSFFFKIYPGDSDIHQKIKKLISKESISNLLSGYDYETDTYLSQLLSDNKVFRDIYLMSRTGHITQEWVVSEYGKYGMDVIRLMLDQNILLEIDKNVYVQGAEGVSKTSDALKRIMSELISEHLDKDKLEIRGENSAYYMVEGISLETKQKLLQKLDGFKKEIAEMIFDKANRGEHRVFMLAALDELSLNKNTEISIH